ncbi:MAG: hypothetical protein ABEJ78_05370 [Haloferacaceae archaeon]
MLAFAYVLGVFGATGVVLYLARRRLRVARDEPWEAEVRTLAAEVRTVTADVDDFDTARRRLAPLASRIDGHARRAPPDADERLRRSVHELGAACRTFELEPAARPPGETSLDARLDALDEAARAVERAVADRATSVRDTNSFER